MLFPGINKMGRQLGLFSSGAAIFGRYRDFSICAYDGSNKKELLIRMNQSLNEQDIESLRSRYKFKKADYVAEEFTMKVEFSEIVKPYSYKKIISLTDEVIDLCLRNGIQTVNKCDNCDNQTVNYYEYNGIPLTLCSGCFSRESFKVDQARIAYSDTENNYLQGLFGSVLFSIPGIILQALLFIFLSRLGAVSSVIYCLLALYGFKIFKGKAAPLSAGFIILISQFMTVAGTIISYSGLLFYKTRDLQRVIELLSVTEIQNELRSNVILQVIISAFYLVFEFFSLRKNWTFKTLKQAEKLS